MTGRGGRLGGVATVGLWGLAVAACGGADAVPVDAELGMHSLTGVVRYEDRPQQSSGRLGTLQALPARGVQLTLLTDDDGEILGTGVTGDDGSYTFEYTRLIPAEPVHLLAATVGLSPERPIEVHNRQGQVHGFGGPSFGNEAFTQDLLVTDASGESAAFNVFDQLVINADAIRIDLGLTPPKLTAIWERGSNDGTYYSGNRTMHLLGSANDDDGYDDTVILHEAGHFIEDTLGRSDSPGGSHDGSPTNPLLAWSEGFSTYWAMAALHAPFYGDSNSGGGWGYNADVSIERAPMPTGGMEQLVAENMITEVLWDMGDAVGPDDDTLPGDHLAVRTVQPAYLRTASLRAVGRSGVDLVDFLDGWFVADGLTRCAAVRAIVTTTRGFPYDYAGPAGVCP